MANKFYDLVLVDKKTMLFLNTKKNQKDRPTEVRPSTAPKNSSSKNSTTAEIAKVRGLALNRI